MNNSNFSVPELWTYVSAAAIMTLAAIVILAYYFTNENNETVDRRKANIKKLVNYILMSGMTFITIYCILVSASGLYRELSYWYGLGLVAIGLAIATAVCAVGFALTLRIWNKAHRARSRKSGQIKWLRLERDFYRKTLEASEGVIDLNFYAEDLPKQSQLEQEYYEN